MCDICGANLGPDSMGMCHVCGATPHNDFTPDRDWKTKIKVSDPVERQRLKNMGLDERIRDIKFQIECCKDQLKKYEKMKPKFLKQK